MLSKIRDSIGLNNQVPTKKNVNIFKEAYSTNECPNHNLKKKYKPRSAINFTPKLKNIPAPKEELNNDIVCFIEKFNKYPEILAKHAKNIERLGNELIQAKYFRKITKPENYKFFGFTFSTNKKLKAAEKKVKDLTDQLQAAGVAQSKAMQKIPPEYQPLLGPDDNIHSGKFHDFLNIHAVLQPDNLQDIIETQEKYYDALVIFEQISDALPPNKALCFINFLNEQIEKLDAWKNILSNPKSTMPSATDALTSPLTLAPPIDEPNCPVPSVHKPALQITRVFDAAIL